MSEGCFEMKIEYFFDYIYCKFDIVFLCKVKYFFFCIVFCYICFLEIKDDGEFSYQVVFLDEFVFVEVVKDMGMLLVDRVINMIMLQFCNFDGMLYNELYQVLDVIEFISKRKCMFIIVCMFDNCFCIICKGVDNVIIFCFCFNQFVEQKVIEIV